MTHSPLGFIASSDPIAQAIDRILDVGTSTPAQNWLRSVQIPKAVPGIFGCADDTMHPQDTRTLAAKEAKRHE